MYISKHRSRRFVSRTCQSWGSRRMLVSRLIEKRRSTHLRAETSEREGIRERVTSKQIEAGAGLKPGPGSTYTYTYTAWIPQP